MKILLPDHSEPCHCVTIYDGIRYIAEHLIDRQVCGNEFDVSEYLHLGELRLEHSPADLRGSKQPPEYRAIARIDGIWHPFDLIAPAWGLPVIAKTEVTDLHPVGKTEATVQEATQSEAKNVESLAPASDKEKKSRTRP